MSTIDEKKLADDFASGAFKRKKDDLDLKAMATKTKDSRINLRLQEDVLNYFQDLSAKEGIPYQTLINSVLFKVATGQLVESDKSEILKEIKKLKSKISKLEVQKQA